MATVQLTTRLKETITKTAVAIRLSIQAKVVALQFKAFSLMTTLMLMANRYWASLQQLMYRLSKGVPYRLHRAWDIASDGARGLTIERLRGQFLVQWKDIGQRLPKNFPQFDFWDGSRRIATSVKSMRIWTYTPQQAYYRCVEYVNKVLDFERGRRGGIVLTNEMISKKVVELWLRLQGTTVQHIEAISKAINYARDNGVELRVFFL